MSTIETIDTALGALTVQADGAPAWLELGRDPRAVGLLAAELAEQARRHEIGAVASWRHPEDAVLAHELASALGVPRLSVQEDLGRLSLTPSVETSARVLFVHIGADADAPLEAVGHLLAGRGHTLAAVVHLTAQGHPGAAVRPVG